MRPTLPRRRLARVCPLVVSTPARHGPRQRIALLIGTVAFVLAGCQGGSPPGVAAVGSSTSTSIASSGARAEGSSGNPAVAQLAFAKCMQEHGEPDYPDPGGNDEAQARAVARLDPNSPQFQAAEKDCQHDRPKAATASLAERQAVQAQALKFSQCMRSHGMANWPDPGAHGYMVALAGAAARSLTYLKAVKICRPLLPTG